MIKDRGQATSVSIDKKLLKRVQVYWLNLFAILPQWSKATKYTVYYTTDKLNCFACWRINQYLIVQLLFVQTHRKSIIITIYWPSVRIDLCWLKKCCIKFSDWHKLYCVPRTISSASAAASSITVNLHLTSAINHGQLTAFQIAVDSLFSLRIVHRLRVFGFGIWFDSFRYIQIIKYN